MIAASTDQAEIGVGLVARTGGNFSQAQAQAFAEEFTEKHDEFENLPKLQASAVTEVNTSIAEYDGETRRNVLRIEGTIASTRFCRNDVETRLKMVAVSKVEELAGREPHTEEKRGGVAGARGRAVQIKRWNFLVNRGKRSCAIKITSIYHPCGWRRSVNLKPVKDKTPDSEKITINLGYVDLGRIDLLVQEGFYANRTDLIRTAIRNQLTAQGRDVDNSVARHTLELGLRDYDAAALKVHRDLGEMLHVRVVGLARIAADVTPELARATIASITVLGALQASAEIKAALADRIH